MRSRRVTFLLACFAALALSLSGGSFGVAGADAHPRRDHSSRKGKKSSKAKRHRARRARARRARARRARARRRRRARRRHHRNFRGHAARGPALRKEPLSEPSGDIWVYAENFHEQARVNIYGKDGEFDEESLAVLDHVFRCRRTGETRAVDPRLYRILSTIYDHFGQKRIDLISGFRYQSNEGSRHFHASAMDIRIPGVPLRKLWRFAKSLDTGGMGIGLYPRARFIHVDFRAPGTPSYRWIDRSRPGTPGRGHRPNKRWRKLRSKKPNS